MNDKPVIWCLLGRKAGDNTQLRALAEHGLDRVLAAGLAARVGKPPCNACEVCALKAPAWGSD